MQNSQEITESGALMTVLRNTSSYATQNQGLRIVKEVMATYTDMIMIDPWTTTDDGYYKSCWRIENTNHYILFMISDTFLVLSEFIN